MFVCTEFAIAGGALQFLPPKLGLGPASEKSQIFGKKDLDHSAVLSGRVTRLLKSSRTLVFDVITLARVPLSGAGGPWVC